MRYIRCIDQTLPKYGPGYILETTRKVEYNLSQYSTRGWYQGTWKLDLNGLPDIRDFTMNDIPDTLCLLLTGELP